MSKAARPDELLAEAIKQERQMLGGMLALVFNGCLIFIHNVLLQQLMDDHNVPVVKINVQISQIKIIKDLLI